MTGCDTLCPVGSVWPPFLSGAGPTSEAWQSGNVPALKVGGRVIADTGSIPVASSQFPGVVSLLVSAPGLFAVPVCPFGGFSPGPYPEVP